MYLCELYSTKLTVQHMATLAKTSQMPNCSGDKELYVLNFVRHVAFGSSTDRACLATTFLTAFTHVILSWVKKGVACQSINQLCILAHLWLGVFSSQCNKELHQKSYIIITTLNRQNRYANANKCIILP